MTRLFSIFGCVFCIGFLVSCGSVASPQERLILATTTSTQDSGLLDELVPLFEAESGYTVQTVAVGTGAALKMAEEGNADVLLVHAPSAEQALMDAGFGRDRLLIMTNDFVLVGPPDDPAGIHGYTNAAEALSAIGEQEIPFVSRGDDSGTNIKELSIWADTPFDPNDSKPGWYVESGQGMGATLLIASERFGYTLTDRATYLANRQNLNLDILVEGDDGLLNIYHAITVNPDMWPDSNYDGAIAFANFLTAAETQEAIGQFGVEAYGQPLFFANAN